MSQSYRSGFNPMMFRKNVKHSGKPKHEANQFIYDKFVSMRDSAGQKQNKGAYHCYNKILKTLEKYPMPVLNAKQALELEGVGPKTAAIIANLITKHYASKIQDPNLVVDLDLSQEELIVDEQLPADELLEDYNQHSQDVDLRARIQRIENIIQESPHKVKREEKLKDIPKEMPSSNFSVSIYEPIKRNRLDQPEDPEDEEFESIMKKYFSLKKTKTEEEDDKKSEESDDLDFMVKPKEPEFKPFDSDFKLFSLKKDSKELSDPKTQSKKKRNYKPDTNSSGCFILLGLKFYEEETGKKYALKKDIKDQLKKSADTLGPMEVKSWNAIDTLTKNELVVPFKFNDEMKYSLSLAGKELADELCLEKLAEKKSGASTKTSNESSNSLPVSNAESDVVFIDKTNLPIKTPKIAKSTSFESETQQVSFSSQPNKPFRYYSQESAPIKGTSELQKKDNLFEIPEDDYYSQSQTQGFMSQSLSRREKLLENYEQKASVEGHYAHKIMKNTIKNIEVTLYVDNRELKNKVERNFIFDKLSEAGVKCKLMALPLGDFLWVVDIQGAACNQTFTLDYVVERKTADDLASSILDNRYAQQKFRLKQSKLKNVFYLVEGKPSQNVTIKESALDTAMLHTQILNGLKVRQTVNLQDTIKWLIMMNTAIESKVLQDLKNQGKEYLEFQYNYDEYQVITAKNNMTIKILFGNMMRQVKGVGKETINEIMDKFESFFDFYNHFMKIPTEEKKLAFLGQKQKKSKKSKKGIFEEEYHDPKELHVNKNVASNLMTLFTADVYPKILSKDTIKFHEDTAL